MGRFIRSSPKETKDLKYLDRNRGMQEKTICKIFTQVALKTNVKDKKTRIQFTLVWA